MPALSQHLVAFSAAAMSARSLRKRRQPAAAAQHRILGELLRVIGRCEVGRAAGVSPQMGYDDYRRAVAPRTYSHVARSIQKMSHGAADLLWPGTCALYATTAGTTGDAPKLVPMTEAMVAHFRQAGLDALLYYTSRVGRSDIFKGRQLFVGGSATLTRLETGQAFRASAGTLGGIAARRLPPWAARTLYEPGLDIAQMTDWPAKLRAISERTWNRDIRVVAGLPNWLLSLAETLKNDARARGRPVAHLQELWPKLECLIHGGLSATPYVDDLRAAFGPKVNCHEVYAAAEALIAAQDADAAAGLRLMTDAGVFYEFIPLRAFDESRLAYCGEKAVPVEGVTTGTDYVLLLTTPGGLFRYVLGDVVRFLSVDPPRLVYVGRTQLQLSAFGENVTEKELTEALRSVCQRHQWSLVHFHTAPLVVSSLVGQKHGRHEWWIELRPHTLETPTGPLLAGELDIELSRVNSEYETKRKANGLDAPVVRLVMPGVFERWMRERGHAGGQYKMPRCRNDRTIADALADIARFAKDQ